MVTPAAGAISISTIRKEIGPSAPYDLNSIPFRRMARKPSGTLSMSDFYSRVAPNMGALAAPSSLAHDTTINATPTARSLTVVFAGGNSGEYQFGIVDDYPHSYWGYVPWCEDGTTTYSDNYMLSWTWDSVGAGILVTANAANQILDKVYSISATLTGARGTEAVCRFNIVDRFDPSRYVNTTITLRF